MTACNLHLDFNKKKKKKKEPWPRGLLIELSEPNRSDKDTARRAEGSSTVPARNRAEPNSEGGGGKEDEAGCTREGDAGQAQPKKLGDSFRRPWFAGAA